MEKIISIDYEKISPCINCKKPIKFYWYNTEKTNGQSERYQETLKGNICKNCSGIKPLEYYNNPNR